MDHRFQTQVLRNDEEASLMVMTWNCGGRQPTREMDDMKGVLKKYLSEDPALIVFGLQEVCELNFNSFIRASARKQQYQKWEKFLSEAVNHYGEYTLISRRTELMGLQMVVFAKPSLVSSISFKAASYVMCGGGGFVGNKGGVGWRMNINQTSIAFCCVHLAAGHGSKAAEMRVLDAQNVENMEFEYRMRRWNLSDHDIVIFFGDTNSRLMVDQVEAQEIMDEFNTSLHHCNVNQIVMDWLPHDEFLQLQTEGAILQGFYEAPILFPPTYKHVVGSDGFDAAGMTASGKIRVPGWTDRVFYKCPTNRPNRTDFMIDSYAWEPQLKVSDHRPVVFTARFTTMNVCRPIILQDTLVPLLTESPTRTYLYPFRALKVMVRWRLSTKVLLGYFFFACWLVSACVVALISCSNNDHHRPCSFTQFYDILCSEAFSIFEKHEDTGCVKQILFFPATQLFESMLIYGFVAQIVFVLVKESLFNRTIHALGSEAIATHVDSIIKQTNAMSCKDRVGVFVRRASVEFIFGTVNLIWGNLWFLVFAVLSIQISITIGGPPRCKKDLEGYNTMHYYDSERCRVSHWDDAPDMAQEDWLWRRLFVIFSLVPWILVNGIYCGFLSIVTLASFFNNSISPCEVLSTFWRVKGGFFPFGISAAIISTIPGINLIAPMSNAVAVALWVIDVDRMLQAPRTLHSQIASSSTRK